MGDHHPRQADYSDGRVLTFNADTGMYFDQYGNEYHVCGGWDDADVEVSESLRRKAATSMYPVSGFYLTWLELMSEVAGDEPDGALRPAFDVVDGLDGEGAAEAVQRESGVDDDEAGTQ